MKILFTSTGSNWDSILDPRFGRAPFLVQFDDSTNEFIAHDNQEVLKEAHGAGTATAQKVFDLKPDIIITGNGPGGSAAKVLKLLNVKVFTIKRECSLQEAYADFNNNKLFEFSF